MITVDNIHSQIYWNTQQQVYNAVTAKDPIIPQ